MDPILDATRYRFVTVGYIPSSENAPPPGTKILFDPVMSKNFESAVTEGIPLVPGVLVPHLNRLSFDGNISRCRAQIMAQSGVTDVRTAETLVGFYQAVERSQWDKLSSYLDDDLDYWIPKSVFEQWKNRGHKSLLFIEQTIRWRSQYNDIWYDVEWANISSERAMIKFAVVSEGRKILTALSEYAFETVGDEVLMSAVWNHSDKSAALHMFN